LVPGELRAARVDPRHDRGNELVQAVPEAALLGLVPLRLASRLSNLGPEDLELLLALERLAALLDVVELLLRSLTGVLPPEENLLVEPRLRALLGRTTNATRLSAPGDLVAAVEASSFPPN
jgi:hypothetical protein